MIELNKIGSETPIEKLSELITRSIALLKFMFKPEQFCLLMLAFSLLREVPGLYRVLPVSRDVVSAISMLLQLDSAAVSCALLAAAMNT